MTRIVLVLILSVYMVQAWRFHLLPRHTVGQRKEAPIDWCKYWESLGIVKEECSHRSIDLPDTTTQATTTASRYWDCRNEFYQTTCRRHEGCVSGKLCMDVASNVCCEPPKNACPTTIQMGIKCFKPKPTNWCHNEFDCATGSLCCDTGCNYNICI